MRNKILKLLVMTLAVTGGAMAAANADVVLYVDDSGGNIGTVDVTTGTSHVIGNSGQSLTDIGFNSAQNLYGVSFSNFYSINKTTGAASLVGSLGLFGMNALVGNSGGGFYGASFTSTNLYSINQTTGRATALSGSTGFVSAGDLAFHGGYLYESAVNRGHTDLLRLSISGNSFTSTDIGHLINNQNLLGLAEGSNGLLYGVDGSAVYTINVANAHITRVVNDYTRHGGLGQAFGAASMTEATPVPEPGSLGLLGMGTLLLGLALRRKAKKANG